MRELFSEVTNTYFFNILFICFLILLYFFLIFRESDHTISNVLIGGRFFLLGLALGIISQTLQDVDIRIAFIYIHYIHIDDSVTNLTQVIFYNILCIYKSYNKHYYVELSKNQNWSHRWIQNTNHVKINMDASSFIF